MRQGSIDAKGNLYINRQRPDGIRPVIQCCPFIIDTTCSDQCPFFTDMPETQEMTLPGQMVRLSCMNEWPADCLDIVKDERKPSKKETDV